MNPDTGDAGNLPFPSEDWMTQRELAEMFGISERTASLRAQKGMFRRYQHGVPGCGRKKYSRNLIEADLRCRWKTALRNQAGRGTVR